MSAHCPLCKSESIEYLRKSYERDGVVYTLMCTKCREHFNADQLLLPVLTFTQRGEVPEMVECMKVPVVVHAVQINQAFKVETLEGTSYVAKPGDYLMRGVQGELYPCDKEIFERTYTTDQETIARAFDTNTCDDDGKPFFATGNV